MHALRLHAFGPPENLRYERVPDPEPGPGEVRVAVAAAGVHVIDTALRAGATGGGPFPVPALPAIPGREVAGTVEAVGEGTDPSWLGRRVVAHLGTAPGGYAELAVTSAERLHALPGHVSEDTAVVGGIGRCSPRTRATRAPASSAPPGVHRFPLAEAAAAHRAVAGRATIGKVVLRP